MPTYLFGSIIGGLIVTLGEVFSIHRELASQIIELIAYSIFMIFSLYSSITACRMLTKPGVSVELRKLIMSRHMAYTCLYTICNLFVAVRNVIFISEIDDELFNDQWYVWVLSILFYCQGIFIALLRWYEPAFYQIAWR